MRAHPTALILLISALAITQADSFADVKSGPIEGEYRIDSDKCGTGKPKPLCNIYLELRGSIARELYENMKSRGVADLCTEGRVKSDRDALRCYRTGSGEYVCDVGYNFARQTLVGGDMIC